MPKKRVAISKTVEKRIFQEAQSRCVFCPESEVASLQIHHMDGDPSNNQASNLGLVCASCHTKITAAIISEADVRLRKRQLEWAPTKSGASVSVSINNSKFSGDIAQNITKISTRGSPRIQHPPGSIGADLEKRGYLDYLITQYFEFREADGRYGRKGGYAHAEIHKTIQRTFGCKTLSIPVQRLPEVIKFLQMRIDRTILGKHNRSRGIPNYHSFEDHFR
jgi:hypothetical protein